MSRKDNFLTVANSFLGKIPLPKEQLDKEKKFINTAADNAGFQTETDAQLASRFKHYVTTVMATANRLMDDSDKWDAVTLRELTTQYQNEALQQFAALQSKEA